MLLNDRRIRSLADDTKLVYPFYEERLQPASYDVTLSSHIIRFVGRGVIDASTKVLTGGLDYHDYDIPDDGYYVLDPGEFILGCTYEYITLPSYIASRFEGKSSLGRLGLATHVTAGFIDPGFQGQITLEIKNMNQFPIHISPGMRIGQLCFFELDPCEHPYGSEEAGSHYQRQIGPTVACISE